MIIVNQVRCDKCGDLLFSKTRHEYVTCKCGSISIDGGQEYLKRVGDTTQATEMSYSLPRETVDACLQAVKWAKENGRNDLGIALAVIRALKDNNSLITDGET